MPRSRLLIALLVALWPCLVAAEPLPTQLVAQATFPRELPLEGVVEAVNQATLSARVAGLITEVNFDVNEYVRQGQVLLRIKADQSEAALKQATSALREAHAHLIQTEREHNRQQQLFDKKLATPAAMEQQRTALAVARARLEAAKAGLRIAEEQLGDTVLEAPYAGFVIRRHVELGEAVSPGQPLFSGVSLEQLRVRVDVPQYLVEQVRQARQVTVRSACPEVPAIDGGKVVIFPFADERSHTFRTRIALPERIEAFYPGMLVKVLFITGEEQRLLTPAGAVVQRGEVTGVYVLDERERPRFRSVRTGQTRPDGRMEVLAGLTAGERVVLDPVKAGQLYRTGAPGSSP